MTRIQSVFLLPLLICIPLAAAPLKAFAGSEQSCYLAQLTGDGINLRTAPRLGPHDGVQGALGERFPVRVVEAIPHWIQITEGKYAGRYLHSKFVDIFFREQTKGCEAVEGSAEVIGNNLNVREAPSLGSPVKAQLLVGDPLNVAPAGGEWLMVLWPENVKGYFVHRDFVKIRLPAAE